jgi:arsenite transporter
MIWNELAQGDTNYCAILVIINSVLQIVLYSPYALLCINVIGGGKGNPALRLSYKQVAISVLIVRSFDFGTFSMIELNS